MQQACTKEQLPIFNKIFKKYLEVENNIFKVKTYFGVCKALKRKVLTEKDFAFLPVNQRKKVLATHKIKNLEDYFNQGWISDYNNPNEYKHYPYFRKINGRWSFGGSYCFSDFYSGGQVSVYQTEEISNHIGNNFKDIYIDFID